MSSATKIFFAVIITAFVVGAGVYFWQQDKQQVVISDEQPIKNLSTITIMVPENYDLYKQKMTEFVQVSGEDPLKTMSFVKKELEVPHTYNIIRASAQAAAEEITIGGGPQRASIAYLKIQNGTAYTLLDIDLDGWAGVSVSIGIIHPIVEKTLLQFSEIKKVVFGYAPGDK